LGYIRRKDVFKVDPEIQRVFWPKGSSVQKHGFTFNPIFVWKPGADLEMSDYKIVTGWSANFHDTSEFKIEMINRFTRLYEPFDPTNTDGAIPLPDFENYYYTAFDTSYMSDSRKPIFYTIRSSIGKFYNGEKYSVMTQINLRVQPYFTSSILVNYDRIDLPEPYPSASIWLIGPKVDITFNKRVFWSTFIQYSSQSDNFSVNSRLQWQFAPLSDLYLVYNDNYFTETVFAPRVRSLNLKLTYWLTI